MNAACAAEYTASGSLWAYVRVANITSSPNIFLDKKSVSRSCVHVTPQPNEWPISAYSSMQAEGVGMNGLDFRVRTTFGFDGCEARLNHEQCRHVRV